jgi:hypothetical protein
MNGGSISPYRGSPYASVNDAMKAIPDGARMAVTVYDDRVEWMKDGGLKHKEMVRVSVALRPSFYFLDGCGGEVDNVLLAGLGLTS